MQNNDHFTSTKHKICINPNKIYLHEISESMVPFPLCNRDLSFVKMYFQTITSLS